MKYLCTLLAFLCISCSLKYKDSEMQITLSDQVILEMVDKITTRTDILVVTSNEGNEVKFSKQDVFNIYKAYKKHAASVILQDERIIAIEYAH